MNFDRRKVAIFAYHPASEGAKLLSQHSGIKRIKHKGSRWNPRGKYLINWGYAGNFPLNTQQLKGIINRPEKVALASNKLRFFDALSEQGDNDHAYLPAWTNCRLTANSWVADGTTVVCRTVLNGHEGRGIVLASTPEELVDAPLFTKYIKKKAEYRVHVIGDKVVDVQQKKRRLNVENNGDPRIRNTANGFVFCRDGIEVPDKVKTNAIQAVKDIGLDFGGVDVVYNAHYDKAYVIEVNTAPGIEGSTLASYTKGFDDLLNAL